MCRCQGEVTEDLDGSTLWHAGKLWALGWQWCLWLSQLAPDISLGRSSGSARCQPQARRTLKLWMSKQLGGLCLNGSSPKPQAGTGHQVGVPPASPVCTCRGCAHCTKQGLLPGFCVPGAHSWAVEA